MTRDLESGVAKFYDTLRWDPSKWHDLSKNKKAYSRWADNRECAKSYAQRCRSRAFRHIPSIGEYMLDVGCGPLQFDEYVNYSKNFKKRYCVELSARALEAAQAKIGDHGVFFHGSFFDFELEDNFFDCSLSLLTIFNIHKDEQEAAVRKLIRVTKPGKPVIIVYLNPHSITTALASSWPARIFQRIKEPLLRAKALRKGRKRLARNRERETKQAGSLLYFHRHPIEWWSRFSDVATVAILPWASLNTLTQKAVIPDNRLGAKMLDFLFVLEEWYPQLFGRYAEYPLIVLTKKSDMMPEAPHG
jgi:SAM-dependent methyltransferase